MIGYIQHILEIEEVKKELKEVKEDNKILAKQVENNRINQGGWR